MVVVAFLLDISELPSLLYIYDASPYQWNFLEGHLEWYDILLIYALSSEETFLLGMSSQPFHLLPTHGTLNLTPSLLFIRSRTNQRPQPRPKAQYIILGPCPYNP